MEKEPNSIYNFLGIVVSLGTKNVKREGFSQVRYLRFLITSIMDQVFNGIARGHIGTFYRRKVDITSAGKRSRYLRRR